MGSGNLILLVPGSNSVTEERAFLQLGNFFFFIMVKKALQGSVNYSASTEKR